MKVIKKINNNVAICIDDKNRELIAFGKGIGFPKMPYILSDLSQIDRTFYGVNSQYYSLFKDIPEDIFCISARIVEYARGKLDYEINPNILFVLADHINFAITRYHKNIYISTPLNNELRQLYKIEMHIGYEAINYINKMKNIHMLSEEAVGIALHFINGRISVITEKVNVDEEGIIDNVIKIIEENCNTIINKETINYSRFSSHMTYLLKRIKEEKIISSDNIQLFETIKDQYPNIYICCTNIKKFFEAQLNLTLNKEELLYLMLHINRLCSREDCNF